MSAVNDFIITNLNAENSHLSKQTDENKNNYISVFNPVPPSSKTRYYHEIL